MQEFRNVWLRESKANMTSLLAMQDIGVLQVSEGLISYQGKKYNFNINKLVAIEFTQQGADFVNKWVKMVFDSAEGQRSVYIKDGSLLGWGGIFGGTKKLYEVIRAALRS